LDPLNMHCGQICYKLHEYELAQLLLTLVGIVHQPKLLTNK
jgi:hypothetical protein